MKKIAFFYALRLGVLVLLYGCPNGSEPEEQGQEDETPPQKTKPDFDGLKDPEKGLLQGELQPIKDGKGKAKVSALSDIFDAAKYNPTTRATLKNPRNGMLGKHYGEQAAHKRVQHVVYQLKQCVKEELSKLTLRGGGNQVALNNNLGYLKARVNELPDWAEVTDSQTAENGYVKVWEKMVGTGAFTDIYAAAEMIAYESAG